MRVSTGTIKKVVSDRGFGFIAADDGNEYFFHRDSIIDQLRFDDLRGGEKVEFETQTGPKGLRAVKVRSA